MLEKRLMGKQIRVKKFCVKYTSSVKEENMN